MCDVTIMS